jgi:aspartyl-tRNA(Asn)/glutamyl-tRNA(Gln) amidotransferase subunit A
VPDLTDLGVVDAAEAVVRGRVSSLALVEASLARIAATDPDLQAWVMVDTAGAFDAAAARDSDLAAGRPSGPLHGVPIGIKDIIDVAGLPTRAGAAAFAHRLPDRDATLVARLRAAGAVIIGKTQTTEFAFKDPAPTCNPWASDRTPGGSSSGSAAAVAARHVPGAIGTQTVGSVLRPAAYCGVVGLKGGFGQVPLDGVAPLAPSFDHAGPIARSVADVARLEAVLAGESIETVPAGEAGDAARHAAAAVSHPRLGVARELLDLAEPALRRHIEDVVARCRDDGAIIEDVALPSPIAGPVAAGRVILESEAAAVHRSMFAAHGDDYGPGIAGLVRAGLARRPAELAAAQRARAAYRDDIAPLLASVDALLSPVAPGPAPRRSEGTGDFTLCAPWSFIGVPSISLPTGLGGDGLPLALQLVAGVGRVDRLLATAAWCERVVGFDARPAT